MALSSRPLNYNLWHFAWIARRNRIQAQGTEVMTTGIADQDRISFAAGKGLSAGFLVSGVIILALAAMVGGVMISQDFWEREVGLALAFLAGVGVISSVVGLAPLFMGRRVVDFKGGEIRTPTGRCPLWQVRSVTVSSRMWTVPLSGFRGGRSSVASGSPTEVQMYELGVVTSEVELDATGVSEQLRTERLTSGHHVGLNQTPDGRLLLRQARDLARRLDVPLLDTTEPNRPQLVASRTTTSPPSGAAPRSGPPPLLTDAPDSVNAGVEGESVVIRSEGSEIPLAGVLAVLAILAFAVFFGATGGIAIPPLAELDTSTKLAGLSGLLLTIACFVLIVLVVGGHHRKTLRVGPPGIERSTDLRWSRAATIPLPDIIDVQTITVTRRAGRSTTTEYSVDIIGENRSIRHACDDEDAASWIQQQLRDAISYLRATPFEPAPG